MMLSLRIIYYHQLRKQLFRQNMQPTKLNQHYDIYYNQLLGKGSTGDVYRGYSQIKLTPVAIKVIDLASIDNQVTRYLLSCEIAALSNLGKNQSTAHQNIVRLIEIVIKDRYIFLVMELLEGGTLSDYIKNYPNGMSEGHALHIFRQLISGYRQIKNKQIIHRDLKPDNVIFKHKNDGQNKVAIIDFGYCEMADVPHKPQVYYNVGSPKYMAPEAYVNNQYSQKSDIWAMGVILYQMLVGNTCDFGMDMTTYLESIKKNGVSYAPQISPFFKKLLSKMMEYQPQRRCDCDSVQKELDIFGHGVIEQRSQLIMNLEIAHQNGSQQQGNDLNVNERSHVRNKNNPIFRSTLISPTYQNQLNQKIGFPLQPNQPTIDFHSAHNIQDSDSENQTKLMLPERKMIKSNSNKQTLQHHFNKNFHPNFKEDVVLQTVENNQRMTLKQAISIPQGHQSEHSDYYGLKEHGPAPVFIKPFVQTKQVPMFNLKKQMPVVLLRSTLPFSQNQNTQNGSYQQNPYDIEHLRVQRLREVVLPQGNREPLQIPFRKETPKIEFRQSIEKHQQHHSPPKREPPQKIYFNSERKLYQSEYMPNSVAQEQIKQRNSQMRVEFQGVPQNNFPFGQRQVQMQNEMRVINRQYTDLPDMRKQNRYYTIVPSRTVFG